MLAWIVAALSFAAAGASFIYVPFLGRKLAVVLAFIGFMAIAFSQGAKYESGKCDTAALRAELRIAKDDLDAAHAAAQKATEIQSKLTDSERKNQELADALSLRPNACLATDDDAKRLRNIKP